MYFYGSQDTKTIYTIRSLCSLQSTCVSSDIVQYLCFLCPEAIDIDCTLVVDDKNEYDISTLALSIEGQNRNNNNDNDNDNDNDKRDLILRGSNFYRQKINNIDTTAAITTTTDETITDKIKVIVQEQLPPPDNSAIETALRTVANYGEWQAVKSILPLLTYSNSNSNNDDEKENNNEKEQSELEPEPEPLWVTDIRNEMEDYYRKKKERTKEMDRKRRKYFGVVMYDVDIIVDLISTVIPKRKRRNNNKRNNNKNKNKSRSHALDQRRRRNDNDGKMM